MRLSAGGFDLGKVRRSPCAGSIVAAQHDEPQRRRKKSPVHDHYVASALRIRFDILAGVHSDRLIEVEASVQVSDAQDAHMPVQPTSRESRLDATVKSAGIVRGKHHKDHEDH